MSEEKKTITRRDFIRGAAPAALAAALGLPSASCRSRPGSVAPLARAATGSAGPAAQPPATKTAKVVLVRHREAVNDAGVINAEVVQEMLDQAVCRLLDQDDPVRAWQQLVQPTDRVGIKTNVWQFLPTPPEVEQALKRRIMDAGVAEGQILLDDRGARRTLVDCTALINARPARTHHWAGMGGCIKNYIMFSPNPSQYHPDSCASLATLWDLPAVKGKTRLNVLVVLTPQFYGRGPHNFDPRYVWPYRGLFVSTDPVAVDALGAHLLRTKRVAHFGEDRPLTPTTHIAKAETEYGLGVADLERIELVKLGWEEEVLI